MIKIDISKADQVEEFDNVLTQGWHIFTIQNVELKTSQKSGDEYINLTCHSETENKKIWLSLFPESDKPFCHKMLKDFLIATDLLEKASSGEFDEQEFSGSVFYGKIKNKKDKVEGELKTVSNLIEFKNIDDKTITPINLNDISKAGTSAPPEPINDDDIPF